MTSSVRGDARPRATRFCTDAASSRAGASLRAEGLG